MCQNQKHFLNSIILQTQNLTSIIQFMKMNLFQNQIVQVLPDKQKIVKDDLKKILNELLSIFIDIEQTFTTSVQMIQQGHSIDDEEEIEEQFRVKSFYQILGIMPQNSLKLHENHLFKSSIYLQAPISCPQLYRHPNNLKNSHNRGPYRSYTLEEKKSIIQLYQLGYKFASIHRMFGIPQKNIVRWCKNGVIRKKGAGRKVGDQDMQKNIIKWIEKHYYQGQKISMKEIRQLAKRFSTKKQFKSSKGWLKNFIKRHQINQKYSIA